jgi:ubiquinone/menaquinone biosynthesis C-methylase UbiE
MPSEHHYDKIAKKYEKKWSTYLERTHNETLRLLNLKKNIFILDAGCGTGGVIKKINQKEKTANIVGIDSSQEMLARANINLKNLKNITLKKADIQHIPHKDDTFDVVINISNIHYIQDPSKVFKELHRVLKPKGEIIILDWSRDNLLFKFMDLYWKLFLHPYIKCYTLKEMTDMLVKTGFTIQITNTLEINWFWKVFSIKAIKPNI